MEASTSGQQQSRVSQNESGAISYTGMFKTGSGFRNPPCHKMYSYISQLYSVGHTVYEHTLCIASTSADTC